MRFGSFWEFLLDLMVEEAHAGRPDWRAVFRDLPEALCKSHTAH